MSRLAVSASRSVARWLAEPLPADPYVILPGCFAASSTSCLIDRDGRVSGTTTTSGAAAIRVIGIEGGQRVDLDVFEQVRIDDHRPLVRHQHRIAVGIRLRDLLSRQISAGRPVVLDDDLLAELLGDALRHDAGDGIGAAAGGVRHQQPDRLRRISLGQSPRSRRLTPELRQPQ